MCKRCKTPSYDSLFAQKMESHITHVFVYSLQQQEIAFKKFSLQSQCLSDWGHIFANSASCENGASFNFFQNSYPPQLFTQLYLLACFQR